MRGSSLTRILRQKETPSRKHNTSEGGPSRVSLGSRKLCRPGGSALLTTVPVSGWPNVVHCCSVQTEALLGPFCRSSLREERHFGRFSGGVYKTIPLECHFPAHCRIIPDPAGHSPHSYMRATFVPGGRICGKSRFYTAPFADASVKTAFWSENHAASARGGASVAALPHLRRREVRWPLSGSGK